MRSDTVTQPSPAMREAMLVAPVGDDVYGEDPSVNALQARLADELGFEAGLFVPSGTQSNLIGLMAHCQRGDEYIVGMDAHTYKFEGGGAAVFGSVQPQPLDHAPDGTLPLAQIEAAIKPDDAHFARTRLLALENTLGGKLLPFDYVQAATDLAKRHGAGAASRRRAAVQRGGGAGRRRRPVRGGAPHRAVFRQRVGVLQQGPGRARRIGAVRLARTDCARPPHPQDGRWRDAALGFDRAFYLFDADTLEAARLAWKLLAGREGVERRYWAQESGKWVQKS